MAELISQASSEVTQKVFADEPRMFYFGPWDEPGHYFFDEHGRSVREGIVDFPFGHHSPKDVFVDGRLQPGCPAPNDRMKRRTRPEVEGEALLHHIQGWTALCLWDRSVDTRGACNSNFFAEGTFTFDEMVAMASSRFAKRWAKMNFSVIQVQIEAGMLPGAPAKREAETKEQRAARWLDEIAEEGEEGRNAATAPESLERADWRGVLALVDNHPFPVRKSAQAEPMPTAEVLERAAAFDPTDPHVSVAGHQLCIMRLALEMIVAQCGSYDAGGYELITRIQRTAEQALRECGK